MSLVFRYTISFPPFVNPPGRKDDFDDSLRIFLSQAAFQFAVGSLGGNARTYGHIGRKTGDASEGDRVLFREWLIKQPIKCIATIGCLEPDFPQMNMLLPVEGDDLDIENLTTHDIQTAATHAEKIRRLLKREV